MKNFVSEIYGHKDEMMSNCLKMDILEHAFRASFGWMKDENGFIFIRWNMGKLVSHEPALQCA